MTEWITCPNCGEKRDVSNRYTSPANAKRDAEWWASEHESGACVK
jgi:sarcosine oxidase delta subunit